MVALLVVAVSLGGAVKVIGNAANNASRMNNKVFANWVALNQIAKLRIAKEWPKFGEQKGDSEMDDKKSSPFVTVVGFLPKP